MTKVNICRNFEEKKRYMEKQYVFTITISGDRTNIMTSFPLWDKEMFLSEIKGKQWRHKYRYGYIGGTMELLKEMRLDEFESLFDENTFTKEQITEFFRKEISEKYGKHKELKEIVPLKKKDLVRGGVYLDFNNYKYMYLGEVEWSEKKERKDANVKKGNGFSHFCYDIFTDKNAPNVEVLSGIKKLKEFTGTIISLDSEYNYERNMYYIGNVKYKLTLL